VWSALLRDIIDKAFKFINFLHCVLDWDFKRLFWQENLKDFKRFCEIILILWNFNRLF
jgi:hypothetical protein